MSLLRIPSKSEGKLPSIPSESETSVVTPIEVTTKKCRRQILAAAILTIGCFSLGTVFGWATVAIKLMREDNIPFDEKTVASLFIVGALLAGPLAGYLMVKIGRKRTAFFFGVMLVISWLFFVWAKILIINSHGEAAAAMLYMGRFFTGFSGSGSFTLAPVYIREVCDDKLRSFLGSMVPLSSGLGAFITTLIGVAVNDWFILCVLCLSITPFLPILVLFIPDSPIWLLTVHRSDDAHKAFLWYTAGFDPEERERLFRKVQKGVEILKEDKAVKKSERKRQQERRNLRTMSRPVLYPLINIVLLISFQQFSAINIYGTYPADVLEAGKDILDPDIGINLTSFFYLLSATVATFNVDRLGRRPALLVSSILMFLMNVSLGAFFYVKDVNGSDITDLQWIPILTLIIFMSGYSIGFGTMAWVVAGEIGHPDFQEVSGSVATTTFWITAFISTLSFPAMRDSELGFHYTCFMYSAINALGAIFVFIYTFETKGKTQEQIMAHYRGHMYEDNDMGSQSIGSINSKSYKRRLASGDSMGSSTSIDTDSVADGKFIVSPSSGHSGFRM